MEKLKTKLPDTIQELEELKEKIEIKKYGILKKEEKITKDKFKKIPKEKKAEIKKMIRKLGYEVTDISVQLTVEVNFRLYYDESEDLEDRYQLEIDYVDYVDDAEKYTKKSNWPKEVIKAIKELEKNRKYIEKEIKALSKEHNIDLYLLSQHFGYYGLEE